MADLLGRGAEFIREVFDAHASEWVAYVRGSDRFFVPATIATVGGRTADGGGGQVELDHRDVDFVFSARQFRLAGRVAEPEDGDRVEVNRNGTTYRYEVGPRPGMSTWQWADSSQQRLVVHAKLMGSY